MAGATENRLLRGLGDAVRRLRGRRGMSRRDLAERSGLSERFLARIESGSGNISVARLAGLASALGLPPDELLREAGAATRGLVALLGLRGAGKSTVGPALARRLGVPFIELDTLIEEETGLPLGQIFEIHGERYHRRVEREVLTRCVDSGRPAVVATGGGIVTDAQSLAVLKSRCLTIWLKAKAEDHWNRVVRQGDRRPMAGNPDAMGELRGLLADREPLYAGSDLTVDTSSLSVDSAVERIAAFTGSR